MLSLGLDSPLIRMMMSQGQSNAVNTPVNSMGIGAQSTAQRRGAGNTFESNRERIAKAIAKRMGTAASAKGKKKKGKGIASIKRRGGKRGNKATPQLPVPSPGEELGLNTSV